VRYYASIRYINPIATGGDAVFTTYLNSVSDGELASFTNEALQHTFTNPPLLNAVSSSVYILLGQNYPNGYSGQIVNVRFIRAGTAPTDTFAGDFSVLSVELVQMPMWGY